MKAIILAAGMGRRLQEASGGLPKSMIMIQGKSILHRQIESCRQVGIEKFVFVLGFKRNEMEAHILEVLTPEQIQIVENKDYATTNTLYSLWMASKHFDDDFIYFNADVLFRSDLLEIIIKPSVNSQLLLETKSCGEEEVKMIINDENKVLEIGKLLPIPKCAGEFIGIGKFNISVLADFAKYLKAGVDNGQGNNYFEFAVNDLCRDHFLEAVPTKGVPCIEIDFPEDLKRALTLLK